PGDGVTTIKRQRHDIHSDNIRDSATTSGRGRLREDLEPSTWRYTQIEINYAASGNLKGLIADEAWETIEDYAYDEPIGDLDMMEDKVDNPSPQSTPQVLLSFEVYTPPVTYPEEVEETLGTTNEVEHLDETPLEDLGLNTCNHDVPLSVRKIPSFNETKSQPQPLSNCPPLDINLGDKRGLKPPIKPHSPDSFRMKEEDHLTNHTSP
ncbi:hypothetical protein Tco_1061037, partial [Tanacetum coccineum]